MKTATPQTVEPFDLIAFARAHGYRLRNLHDGGSVPPAWRPVRDRGRPAYRQRDVLAIAARLGYVMLDAPGRIGWCVLAKTSRAKTLRVRRIVQAGGVVTQEGDSEAAGWANQGAIREILKALSAWGCGLTCATGHRGRAGATQRGDRGGESPRESACGCRAPFCA